MAMRCKVSSLVVPPDHTLKLVSTSTCRSYNSIERRKWFSGSTDDCTTPICHLSCVTMRHGTFALVQVAAAMEFHAMQA